MRTIPGAHYWNGDTGPFTITPSPWGGSGTVTYTITGPFPSNTAYNFGGFDSRGQAVTTPQIIGQSSGVGSYASYSDTYGQHLAVGNTVVIQITHTGTADFFGLTGGGNGSYAHGIAVFHSGSSTANVSFPFFDDFSGGGAESLGGSWTVNPYPYTNPGVPKFGVTSTGAGFVGDFGAEGFAWVDPGVMDFEIRAVVGSLPPDADTPNGLYITWKLGRSSLPAYCDTDFTSGFFAGVGGSISYLYPGSQPRGDWIGTMQVGDTLNILVRGGSVTLGINGVPQVFNWNQDENFAWTKMGFSGFGPALTFSSFGVYEPPPPPTISHLRVTLVRNGVTTTYDDAATNPVQLFIDDAVTMQAISSDGSAHGIDWYYDNQGQYDGPATTYGFNDPHYPFGRDISLSYTPTTAGYYATVANGLHTVSGFPIDLYGMLDYTMEYGRGDAKTAQIQINFHPPVARLDILNPDDLFIGVKPRFSFDGSSGSNFNFTIVRYGTTSTVYTDATGYYGYGYRGVPSGIPDGTAPIIPLLTPGRYTAKLEVINNIEGGPNNYDSWINPHPATATATVDFTVLGPVPNIEPGPADMSAYYNPPSVR